MKISKAIGPAAAFLLYGAAFPVLGQHDGQGERQQNDKSGQNQNKQEKPRGNPGREASPQQQQARQPQQSQRQEQARPQQQQRAEQPQQQRQQPQQQQARQPQRQEQARPQQQQARPQPDQRAQQAVRQQQQRPQQAQAYQQPQRSQEQAQAWQQRRGWQQQGAWQSHNNWQQNRAQNWSSEHRTWAQRGGYGGYYIPQDRFGLYFGIGHIFRIRSRPVMYMGYPRFEYGGYSFLMVDPWPEYWSENWYDSSDVYIDYDNGYYLHNRAYPQVRLAVTIAM